ncbi:MAG: universal stress protein [Candidatus Promineofilum sp.]|nr:universal stress protein [Promineifilum sp.]MCW5861678.1 universal stress protein [Anaerolineae bacterium]
MFKHLLVPLDGSGFAEAALPYALELAAQFDSDITLLRVIAPPRLGEGALTPDSADFTIRVRDDLYKEAIEYLQFQKGSLRSQHYRAHYQVVEAEDVATEIINTVRGVGADTVVMCTHGRGGLSRWLFGSVATRVLQSAPVPVLIVRPQSATTAA